METRVIRLLAPARVGHNLVPHNAVVEAEASEADRLLDNDPPCAEETDAIERYPSVPQPILKFDEFPVSGSERFPLDPDAEPTVTPSMFKNEFDRQTEALILSGGPSPRLAAFSKERPPAKIEVTKAMRDAGEPQSTSDVAARAAMPVVVVDDETKSRKGKGA